MTPHLRSLFTLTLLAPVLLATAAAAAQFNSSFQGATSATEIDIDADGVPAGLGLLRGRGTAGPVTLHTVFEAGVAANTRCGAGEIQNDLVALSSVIQDEQGSQLLSALVKGHICINTSTGVITSKAKSQVLGGTGRFAGASGRLTTTCQGFILAVDVVAAGPRPAHTALSCQIKGQI